MFIDTCADPLEAFLAIRALVRRSAPDGFDPDTFVLATSGLDGRPSARVVLLRGAGPGGLCFYTNYGSRKAHELDHNPAAALCGHWYWLGQQVRIEGRVSRTSAAESDAYFADRPRGSQIGAWASRQSQSLPTRAALEASVGEMERRFAGQDVPRPPFWGGYRLEPLRFEFWEEGPARLHDRVVFEAAGGRWSRTRLSP